MIQPYDIVMLVVLGGATIWGIYKGMAWQVAALASVFLSAAVAIHGSPSLAPLISAQEPWNRVLAMLILFVIAAAAVWIIFHFISGLIDRIHMKDFDRQLGAIFGLLKGVLYCVIITFFAATLDERTRQMVLQSESGKLIARGIRHANPILPEDVRTYLGKYIDELDAKLSEPPQGPAEEPAAPPSDTSRSEEKPSSGLGR
jgi:membrane protein required for colicin V production